MKQTKLTWPERGRLWLRLGIRLVLVVLALALLVKLGPPLLALFAPFVAALVVAAMLNPAIRWLQRRLGCNRGVLSLLLLLLAFGLIGWAVGLLVYSAGNELLALAQNWEGLLAQGQSSLNEIEDMLARLLALTPPSVVETLQGTIERVLLWLQDTVPAFLGAAAAAAGQWALRVPAFVLALVFFVLGAYFISADYPYLRTRAAQHVDGELLRVLNQIKSTALVAFGGYLRAQLLLSAAVFFILLGGFLLTNQSYALLLALGLAVLDFIPIIGSGTVMVPWAVIALFTGDYSAAISVMVIWGVVAVFRRVAEPKVVGDQTGLPPIWSLISIYVGMRLAGVLGMILAPILTLVVLNLSGLGIFHGICLDMTAAARDVAAILSETPEEK